MNDSRYADRRAALRKAMGPGSVAVFASTPLAIRNNDVEHEFRQDSDLYYLTGFDEPETVLVLSTQHAEHRAVLFVRPRNPERETWDGPRAGVEGAVSQFGADAAFPVADLAEQLPNYLGSARRLYYRVGRDRAFDDRLFTVLEKMRGRARLGVSVPTEIVDPGAALHEMRVRKSKPELDAMTKAVAITREAHLRAMQVARPGAHEYEVEAELLRTFRAHGSERPAYGPIVGSGANATILHYRKNDRKLQDGDLLLIDAGAEYGYYAADVTRTFPVGGRFSPEQRAVYDVVLDAQKASVEAVRPGVTLEDLHDVALRVLTEGMMRLGLVTAPSLAEALEKQLYKPFYMHRTSHWLGMDVHDVGAYFVDGKPRPLEPGFVLTVEPGLYVAANAEVDPKWRGIGVRIEDDVLVTESGHANLTEAIPRDPAELERILAARA